MADIRKIIIIFLVGILFAVLVFSVIEAVYPSPKYEDFCREKFYPRVAQPVEKEGGCAEIKVPEAEVEDCQNRKGFIDYEYDSNGCAKSYECNTCNVELEKSQEEHNRYVFYISAVLSLIAVFIGLYLPSKKNSLNEWIGTGFMLGGTFALFFGTMISFRWLDRFARPVVILLELILVIWIAYKKIGNLREDKKEKKNKAKKKR